MILPLSVLWQAHKSDGNRGRTKKTQDLRKMFDPIRGERDWRAMQMNSVKSGFWRKLNWRAAGWSAAGVILLLPVIAMRVTAEVTWDRFDFALMGMLLGGMGIAMEFAASRSRSPHYRAGAAVAVVTAFMLIWLNLAVGIIGSEDNWVNVMFLLVAAATAAGSLLVRFRPAAMALVMAIGALALAIVPLLAWILAPGLPARDIAEAAVLTGCFAVFWLLSASLFKRAGKD
jgi:hypothetical protein